MRMLKSSLIALVAVVLVIGLSSCEKHHKKLSKSERIALVKKSKDDFQVCNVEAIAEKFTSGDNDYKQVYDTKYIINKDMPSQNYYIVTATNDLNADQVRHIVCKYIRKNKCYVYWGNIATMGMFAAKKAPWFPGDSTPHYMISPYITCHK